MLLNRKKLLWCKSTVCYVCLSYYIIQRLNYLWLGLYYSSPPKIIPSQLQQYRYDSGTWFLTVWSSVHLTTFTGSQNVAVKLLPFPILKSHQVSYFSSNNNEKHHKRMYCQQICREKQHCKHNIDCYRKTHFRCTLH